MCSLAKTSGALGNGSLLRWSTFWAFLSQVLSPESACRDAVRKAQAWWSLGRRRPISSNTSAYCQARTRLSEKTLETIHRQTAQRLEGNVPTDSLWLGRRVKIVDGTGCSMPDTAENQKAYPQPGSQKPGCGFPVMKLVGLFCLASGALLEVVRGTLLVHEMIWPRKRVQAVAQFWLLLDKCKGLVTLTWFLLFFDISVCFNPITIRYAQGRNPGGA